MPKIINKFLLSSAILTLAACAQPQGYNSSDYDHEEQIPHNLSVVKENHAELNKNGQVYVLETFIQPFARPYYIHISSKNGSAINPEFAMAMAKEYIQPRGCTTPIENEQILLRNANNKERKHEKIFSRPSLPYGV